MPPRRPTLTFQYWKARVGGFCRGGFVFALFCTVYALQSIDKTAKTCWNTPGLYGEWHRGNLPTAGTRWGDGNPDLGGFARGVSGVDGDTSSDARWWPGLRPVQRRPPEVRSSTGDLDERSDGERNHQSVPPSSGRKTTRSGGYFAPRRRLWPHDPRIRTACRGTRPSSDTTDSLKRRPSARTAHPTQDPGVLPVENMTTPTPTSTFHLFGKLK